jgi:hypothetical protein
MLRLFLLIFGFYSFLLQAQSLRINEICTKNSNIITDGDFNQFVDWIELFNNTSADINLSGYFISDNAGNKTKWKFPAGSVIGANSYLLIWADGRNVKIQNHHTNFKLNSSSGVVLICDADTNQIDLLEYENQLQDISFGRANSGWAYFPEPTPGIMNSGNAFYSSSREVPPSFTLASGFYNPNTLLQISSPVPGTVVRFTIDGSFPTVNSAIFPGSISLTENTVIRARVFGNKLPSKEVSETYFINLNKDLPVVSLIIDPSYLWSEDLGIFNDSLIEFRTEWERPSTFQYFNNKELKFETNNSIRLFGNTAFFLPQKSFAVFADDPVNYKIFKNKPLSVFNSFIMRSSSDDWSHTMFRDGLIQTIVGEKTDIDYQSYQPTVLYINGEYFGIFNLREKYNEKYLKNNHGVDTDKIDFLSLNYPGLWYEVLAGSDAKLLQLLDYIYSNDITDPAVFSGINEYLDIENYTHYIITQIYIGNGSYEHNIKTWRRNDTVDGFKWLIFDTDRGYFETWRNDFSMIYNSDTIFKRLLDNIDYRNHFLQQTCSHINASFRQCYADHVIDSLKSNIAAEMPSHINKWGPVGGIPSVDAWNQSVQVMHNFALGRKDTLHKHLMDFYNLEGKVNLHLKKTSSRGGNVYIEDVLIPYSDSIHEYFKNIPLTLTAVPNFGYTFVDWEGISYEPTITLTLNGNVTINARFSANCNIPDTISVDAILLKDCSPYTFEHDLFVDQGATLYCEPGVEINFGQDVMLRVKGSLNFTGTEQEPVIIQGLNDQIWKYIEVDGGNLVMNHAIIHSGLKAIHFINGSKLSISYSTFYESAVDLDDLISGEGSELEIENNIFYGNPLNTKKDGIDADNIIKGVFSWNKFYNISDDCIDIGTNSTNITINHNEMYLSQSMGVSIGENSQAIVYRNIIANCNGGIQVHTGAIADIINNTLYNNETAILGYHYENTPNSGGTAHVINTLFSQNSVDFALQPNSVIEISYSLSDKIILPGTGNISGNPEFINPLENNFNLKDDSPCIDAGDVLSELDPDNTRADIGALYFNQLNGTPETKQTVLIYPNPFNRFFNIRLLNGHIITRIELFNQMGERIFLKQNMNNPDFTVELGYKGIVFLKVTDNSGNVIASKLISK